MYTIQPQRTTYLVVGPGHRRVAMLRSQQNNWYALSSTSRQYSHPAHTPGAGYGPRPYPARPSINTPAGAFGSELDWSST